MEEEQPNKRSRTGTKNYKEPPESGYIFPVRGYATSKWTKEISDIANIKVSDGEIFSKLELGDRNDNPLYLHSIIDKMWKTMEDVEDLNIERNLMTLVDEVKLVYDNKNRLDEEYVDSYMESLLYAADMNLCPLSVNPQHTREIQIGENEEVITSKPDFIVKSKKSKVLVVIEDKTLKNASYRNRWKEDQVLGEIFTAAHKVESNSTFYIYAIRAIGTLFTFYRATVTPDYIKESLLGKPETHSIEVIRYPNPGDEVHRLKALDFCKIKERKIIVKHLERIREYMLS